MTGKDVMELLQINKSTLTQLRGDGLPHVKLNRNHCVYLVKDLMEFLAKNTTILEK